MKIISLSPLKGLDGERIAAGDEELTMPQVAAACLARMETRDGVQAVAAMTLAQKIFKHTDENLTLEDAEHKLAMTAIGKNAPGYFALILGQVYKAFSEAV